MYLDQVLLSGMCQNPLQSSRVCTIQYRDISTVLPPPKAKNKLKSNTFTNYGNHTHPPIHQSTNQSSRRHPLRQRICIRIRRHPTGLPIRDLRLGNQLAVRGEIRILIPRRLDPAVEDKHPQTPQVLQPDLAQIIPLGSPLQVLLQIRPQRARFEIGDRAGVV